MPRLDSSTNLQKAPLVGSSTPLGQTPQASEGRPRCVQLKAPHVHCWESGAVRTRAGPRGLPSIPRNASTRPSTSLEERILLESCHPSSPRTASTQPSTDLFLKGRNTKLLQIAKHKQIPTIPMKFGKKSQ